MDASQKTAGIALLLIGVIFGVAALVLAATQHATRHTVIAACAGAVTTLGITVAHSRAALERAGFYGISRKRAAHFTAQPDAMSRGLAGAGGTIGVAALIVAAYALQLTPLALLACIAGFFGSMSLAAGAVHFGFLVAAELKWRFRGGA